MKVYLAYPRGFCAGVARAIKTVELALKTFGAPIYVRHAIVHNRHVVDELKRKGAIFVESLEEIPESSKVIFSAHGVPPCVREEAKARNLEVIDATCPLVSKVHLEVIRYAQQGYSIILIGHKGHIEIVGTAGEAPEKTQVIQDIEEIGQLKVPNPSKVVVLTQTTLSIDDAREIIESLRKKFPEMIEPSKQDICYATQNRQAAIKQLASFCDLVLVIGDPASSNSKRLKEVAEKEGSKAYLIKDSTDIRPKWLESMRTIGVTASASAPERLVNQVVVFLQKKGVQEVKEIKKIKENITFPLPQKVASLTKN